MKTTLGLALLNEVDKTLPFSNTKQLFLLDEHVFLLYIKKFIKS